MIIDNDNQSLIEYEDVRYFSSSKYHLVKCPSSVTLTAGEKIAFVACDEYSLWVVPYQEIEDKINEINSLLDNKLYNKEEMEKKLRNLYNQILGSCRIRYESELILPDIVYEMLTDDIVFFRIENGSLKMYLGKEAFRKSLNEYTYKK